MYLPAMTALVEATAGIIFLITPYNKNNNMIIMQNKHKLNCEYFVNISIYLELVYM